MNTIQHDVLLEIEKIIKKSKLTPRVQFAFSNTGTIYAQKDFKTILRIDFNFQSTYGSFTVIHVNETIHINETVAEFPSVKYESGLERLFSEIKGLIKVAKRS